MKKKRLIGMMFALALLTGCVTGEQRAAEERSSEPEKRSEEAVKENNDAEESLTEENAAEEEKIAESAAKAAEEKTEDAAFLEGIMQRGSSILEDDEAFYACNAYRIYKMDKESQKWSVLWESKTATGEEYGLDSGGAVLIGDTIYFAGNMTGKSSDTALFRIRTDGSGEECLDEFEVDMNTLFLRDGILYATAYGGHHAGYALKEDGSVVRLDSMEHTLYEKVPETYNEQSYCNHDNRYFSVPESYSVYGFFLLKNEKGELVKMEPESGQETVLGSDQLWAYNENYLLLKEYMEEGNRWHLVDVNTLESRIIAEGDDDAVTMDVDYIYWKRHGDWSETREIYERMSIETGEITPFLEINRENFILNSRPSYACLAPEIHDDYLYYILEEDYKLYIRRRNIKDPGQDEAVGDAYYDSGIGALGHVEKYKEEIYSTAKPEVELAHIELGRLVVDGNFAGADEINRILKEEQDNIIAYAEETAGDFREEVLESGRLEEYAEFNGSYAMMEYDYRSDLTWIPYFDGRYVSFYMEGSIYEGQIHGMPYHTGFTFDLQTGKQLTLSDIIGNSEEELKQIVTKYFREYIDRNPERFWDDAVQIVRENTSFYSDFYLTEKGICFYFGPYAIASFADGFQEVRIPYSEFDIKMEGF